MKPSEIKEYIKEMIISFKKDLEKNGVVLKVEKGIIDYLYKNLPPSPKTEEISEIVNTYIITPVNEKIKDKKIKRGDEVKVFVENDIIKFMKKKSI